MSVNHYENFPVASWLMPEHLRPAVKTIYAFARSADDLADEGSASDLERLSALAEYENNLELIRNKQACLDPLFDDLAEVISTHQLPISPFFDLLSAFKQDVTCKRYDHFTSLLQYCDRSANPVGRIMLHLFKETSSDNLVKSDLICSALQLINFWQDIAIDWQKSRVYVPQEDLMRFHVSESQITDGVCNQAWRAMMQFQINRTRQMMITGSPLCKRLPGRFGFELRLVVQGGLRILEKIEAAGMDIFRHRPTIQATDSPLLLWRALKM